MEYANEIFRRSRWVCMGCQCTSPCSLLPGPRPLNCLLLCYRDADDQRLNWTSQVQLYAVIALAALALWFLFDRTWLGLSVSSAVGIGSWLGFMLVITS
jgi:hypothetical protein